MHWTNQGTAFKILDSTKLCDEILQTHFRHKNYASFVRQLNIYGFRKLPKSCCKKDCYFHPKFKQHDKESLREITRNVSSPVSKKKASLNVAAVANETYETVEQYQTSKVLENSLECLPDGAMCENTPR